MSHSPFLLALVRVVIFSPVICVGYLLTGTGSRKMAVVRKGLKIKFSAINDGPRNAISLEMLFIAAQLFETSHLNRHAVGE